MSVSEFEALLLGVESQCSQLGSAAGMTPPSGWRMLAYSACVQLYGLDLVSPWRLNAATVAEKTVANYAAHLDR